MIMTKKKRKTSMIKVYAEDITKIQVMGFSNRGEHPSFKARFVTVLLLHKDSVLE